MGGVLATLGRRRGESLKNERRANAPKLGDSSVVEEVDVQNAVAEPIRANEFLELRKRGSVFFHDCVDGLGLQEPLYRVIQPVLRLEIFEDGEPRIVVDPIIAIARRKIVMSQTLTRLAVVDRHR